MAASSSLPSSKRVTRFLTHPIPTGAGMIPFTELYETHFRPSGVVQGNVLALMVGVPFPEGDFPISTFMVLTNMGPMPIETAMNAHVCLGGNKAIWLIAASGEDDVDEALLPPPLHAAGTTSSRMSPAMSSSPSPAGGAAGGGFALERRSFAPAAGGGAAGRGFAPEPSVEAEFSLISALDDFLVSDDAERTFLTTSSKERAILHKAAELRKLQTVTIEIEPGKKNIVVSRMAAELAIELPPFELTEGLAVFDDFGKMGLPDDLLHGLYAIGFERPKPIQAKAIVPIAARRNVIAQAQSGSGKTGAFVPGVLAVINPSVLQVQAIILCPSAELADQTARWVRDMGERMRAGGINVLCAVGGEDTFPANCAAIRAGAQVIVGTVGRINGLINRNALPLARLRIVVLDEADKMLAKPRVSPSPESRSSPSFERSKPMRAQVADFFERAPEDVQVVLISATFPPDVLELADTFLGDEPVRILVPKEELPLHLLRQFYALTIDDTARVSALLDLLVATDAKTFVFANTAQRVDELTARLAEEGIKVVGSHGKTHDRANLMEQFRDGRARVLVTTDMMAQGIDVPGVSLVINFDVPNGDRAAENYLHRIGRTCRGGRAGSSVTFVGPREERTLVLIRSHYAYPIEQLRDASQLRQP